MENPQRDASLRKPFKYSDILTAPEDVPLYLCKVLAKLVTVRRIHLTIHTRAFGHVDPNSSCSASVYWKYDTSHPASLVAG